MNEAAISRKIAHTSTRYRVVLIALSGWTMWYAPLTVSSKTEKIANTAIQAMWIRLVATDLTMGHESAANTAAPTRWEIELRGSANPRIM